MKTQIKSIKEELADCRKAWAESPNATFAWCCHHEVLIEPLREPAEVRIKYILGDKREEEQATRFRNFRPVRINLPAAFEQARTAYDQAWAAFEQARTAYKQAWAAFEQARTAFEQARTAFEQARTADEQAEAAFDQAWAAYKQAWAADDHNRDWPDNTWTGKSIFN